MAKGKMKSKWIGILIALFAVFLVAAYAIGAKGLEETKGIDALAPMSAEEEGAEEEDEVPLEEGNARADIIMINTLKVFGNLDKPEVVFLHDAHTEALKKQGKDCSACHLPKTNKIPGTFKPAVENIDPLSPKFKRLEDTARKEVMDIYHKFCIDCHADMRKEDTDTGPVTCGECHKESDLVSSRQPMGLDKSLHYRHNKAMEKKCETCHHKYNPEKEILFHAKGEEGTCRYCHLEEDKDGSVLSMKQVSPVMRKVASRRMSEQISKLSMREASHLDCISCHREIKAREQEAGPVTCSGCHSPYAQKKFKKVEDVPRMERKQPDVVMVKTGQEDQQEMPGSLGPVRMSVAPFNHKAHETYNDTCRVCHHASLESCAKCHTISGDKDGGFIKLEQAYHAIESDKSCLGCHTREKNEPECAGCHYFMSSTRRPDNATCLKCHEELTPDMEAAAKKMDSKDFAQMMIKDREYETVTYSEEDIPEKVVIKYMRDKYEAAEMPHRKIVKKMMDNIKDNKLAGYFHDNEGTLCQGCHHNSPASKKPPKCATCHGSPFAESDLHRPGLMAAYHQQCMGCHEVMGLEKPEGCTGCHKKK